MNFEAIKGCGRRTTMGHGESAQCGTRFYSDPYYCEACLTKALSQLQAENERLRRIIQAVPSNFTRACSVCYGTGFDLTGQRCPCGCQNAQFAAAPKDRIDK